MNQDWNYQKTLAQIESIIGKIEAGKINLEDLFSQVMIASQCLQECETYLVQQEQKMDIFIETLTDDINNGEEELEF